MEGSRLSAGVVGVDRPGTDAEMIPREKNTDNHLI